MKYTSFISARGFMSLNYNISNSWTHSFSTRMSDTPAFPCGFDYKNILCAQVTQRKWTTSRIRTLHLSKIACSTKKCSNNYFILRQNYGICYFWLLLTS